MDEASLINQLASSQGRRDESPNLALAETMVAAEDAASVSQLVALLSTATKAQKHDCIKVLYEIAERMPSLIALHLEALVGLLANKDNRLQWGAMTALSALASAFAANLYPYLPTILLAADAGSVITRDHAVLILVRLAGFETYQEEVIPLLLEQLGKAPANQVPMYAEQVLSVIPPEHQAMFAKVLASRLDDFEKVSKRKRVEKVLRRLPN